MKLVHRTSYFVHRIQAWSIVLMILGGTICANCLAQAAEYYVDVDSIGGLCSDENNGTIYKPWCNATKGFKSAQPGDTVYFRQGTYRLLTPGGFSISAVRVFSTQASAYNRITFKGYQDEEAIITSMMLIDNPTKWHNVRDEIYSLDLNLSINVPERVSHVSQYGIPLMLMTEFEDNGGPENLTAEGQWSRNVTQGKLFVWAKGGGNPGSFLTEVAEFPEGGSNTIELYSEIDAEKVNLTGTENYLTFENLTIEGGRYPILVNTDGIEIKNCIIRNCWGDGIKTGGYKPVDRTNPGNPADPGYFNSEYGLVENCDIYNFGEAGIDITGGDYWIIRNNSIHDNVPAQHDKVTTGIMLKNNNIGTLVEKNRIFNLRDAYALTLGGNSWSYGDNDQGIAKEGENLTAKNNIIYNIQGPDFDQSQSYAVGFAACHNCVFYHNLIYGCDVDRIISIKCSDPNQNFKNKDIRIKNNIFWNNTGRFTYYIGESNPQLSEGLYTDYNILDANLQINLNFTDDKTFIEYQTLGYEGSSITSAPIFVDALRSDFRLMARSPGINAAEDLSGIVDDDFEGSLRSDGRPDIGPYEYVARLGDVSGDSEITAYDAALTARLAVGLDELTLEKLAIADVSGDGEVAAFDAALIARRAVGLIEKFPVEE